jgi:hypothetical protein
MNKMMFIMIAVILGFALISIFLGSGIMGDGVVGGGMMGGMMGFGWLFIMMPLMFILFLIYALSGRNRPANSQQEYPPPHHSEFPPPPDQSDYTPPPDWKEDRQVISNLFDRERLYHLKEH